MSGIIKNVLQKMILNYLKNIEGVDEKYVEMKIQSGELVLENLKLQLEQNGNLFQPKSIHIKKLQLSIPWLSLVSSPIAIKAYDITIQVDIVHSIRLKKEILKGKHKLIQQFIKQALNKSQPSSITNTIKKKIISTVINNLNIDIHNLIILFKAGKHFAIDVNFPYIQLMSVSSPKQLQTIHKLIKCEVEINHFNKQKKIKEVYLRTNLTSEMEFSQPTWSSSQKQYFNLNTHILEAKFNLSQQFLTKLQKTLRKIPQPIINKTISRPTKPKDYVNLFRYAVQKVIDQQKYEKFRKLLTYTKFNLPILQNQPVYHKLIYYQTSSTLKQWVNKALKVKQSEQVSLMYFNKYTLRLSIQEVNVLYQINSINSLINIKLISCYGKVVLSNHLQMQEAIFKGNQLQFYFDKRSVVSIENDTQHVIQMMYSRQQKSEQYRIKFHNLKIKLNIDHIDKLIRSLYKFILSSNNNPSPKQKYVDVVNKIRTVYVFQLNEFTLSLNTFIKSKKLITNIWFKKFEAGYYKNQLDLKMVIIFGIAIEQQKIELTQQLEVQSVIKFGVTNSILIQNSNINLDFKKLDTFLTVIKMMMDRSTQLLSFFTTKTYQIECASRLGMLTLKSKKSSNSYFYALNKSNIYLYSFTQQADSCIRSISITDFKAFMSSNRAILQNNQQIIFSSHKELQIVKKINILTKNSNEQTFIKLEVRKTNIAIQFIPDINNHLLIIDIDETTIRYSDKIQLRTDLSLSLTEGQWRIIQANNLKINYNQKKNKKVGVNIEKVLFDYSHQRLLKIINKTKEVIKRINKQFLNTNSQKSIEYQQIEKSDASSIIIDVVISNLAAYFILDLRKRFVKIQGSDILVNMSNIFKLECDGKIFDMTSYPYTKFDNKENFMASTHLIFSDGTLSLSKTKVLFITQPLLRIIDYFLNLLDYYLPAQPQKRFQKSQTKVGIKNIEATLFPTKFKLYSDQIDIVYNKHFVPSLNNDLVAVKIVTINFRGMISSKSQKILDYSEFIITYDITERAMNIQLNKLFLSFSEYSFNKIMTIVFHNLLYSDLFQIYDVKQHHSPSKLSVNISTQIVSVLINKQKSVFEILMKNFWVNYSKLPIGTSNIIVDFQRFKVNQILNDKRVNFINQLRYSIKRYEKSQSKTFLSMTSSQDRGPQMQINVPQLDILFRTSKLLELLTFWNYQLNNQGLKMQPSKHTMNIVIYIPSLKMFVQSPKGQVYQWTTKCQVDYISNIIRSQTTRSSVLVVHINQVSLFPFNSLDCKKQRQMLNKPNIKLTLEMVQDKSPQNPKSIYNLNLIVQKTRLHANLADVLNFHELITQHNPAQKLPTAIMNIQKNVMEGIVDIIKESEQDNTLKPGQVQTMYVFEARIDQVQMIISSSGNQQIVPLIQFIVKCQQCMGTIQHDVQLFNFKMTLFLGYFNLKATKMQPVIETMQFVAELCRNKHVDPSTFLSIIIPMMKLNVSDEMYDTMMRVYKDKNSRLIESQIIGRNRSLLTSTVGYNSRNENRRLISLFSFKNETGFKIVIQQIDDKKNSKQQNQNIQYKIYSNNERKKISLDIGESYNYKVFEDEDDFSRTFEKSVKFKVFFSDKNKDQFEIKSVKINSLLKKQNYIKYYPHNLATQRTLADNFFMGALELAEAQYRKQFILKSQVFFLNQTSQNIQLNFSNGKINQMYDLKKDSPVPIPFDIFKSKQMIFRIKDAKQQQFSSGMSMSKFVLTDQQIEANLPEHYEINTNIVIDNQGSKINLNSYCLCQSFNPKSKIQTILIIPMMRIFNCLPVDLRLDDLNIVIEPNSSREITKFAKSRSSIISFQGYKTTSQVMLFDVNQRIDKYPSIINMNHQIGVLNQRQLKINILRKFKNGVFLIIFSARTIILNQTGLNLNMVLSKTSQKGNICLANEDDVLNITENKNLKTSTSVYLKTFNASCDLEYFEQTAADKQQFLYEFMLNMSVREAEFSGQLVMTKVIELSPKYIIINKSSRNIQLTQPNSSAETLKFKSQQRGLLIWKEPNNLKQLVLRVMQSDNEKTSRWRWSGSFIVNTIRFLYLYTLKKKNIKSKKDLQFSRSAINFDAERIFFQVEMKRQGAHTCIVIDQVQKNSVEYIIYNKTPFTLLVEQQNDKNQMQKDYFCVKSGDSEPFSWIEPDKKKKIKIKILKDQQVIDTNMLLDLSNIKQQGDYYNLRTFNQRFKVHILNMQQQIIQVTSLTIQQGSQISAILPKKKKPKQIFCTFLLKQLGVSIIGSPDGKKIEVFYLQMQSFDITLFWAQTLKIETRIKMFNIDNNSRYQSQYPVFITSSINLDHHEQLNFFELIFQREIKDQIVMKIIQLKAFLVPITIRLDQQLARIIFMFYKSRFKQSSSQFKYKTIQDITTIDYVFAPPKQRQIVLKLLKQKQNPLTMWKHRQTKFSTNFVEIKILEIPTLKISLYFSHVYSLQKDKDQVFGSLYSTFGIAIPSCQNAPINVDGIYLQNIVDTTSQALASQIILVYKNQLISNALAIIGSVNIIGNPVGFFLRISHGFHQLFQKPRRAIRRGPAYVTLAVFSGIFGVINNGLAAVVHFIYSMSKGLSNGLAYLTFDGQYLDRRRQKNRFQPNNVFQGMQSSISSVVFGVQKAMQGIFFCTKRHRDSIGMQTIKALSGIVAKPAVGVLDGAKAVLIGIQNMLLGDVYKPSQQRRRVPRVFYDRIRYFKQYREADAIVYESLIKRPGRNRDLVLIQNYDYMLNGTYMDFVISATQIMLLQDLKILWSINPKQISAITIHNSNPPKTRCQLVITYQGRKQSILQIQKADFDAFNLSQDFRGYVESLKIIENQ